MKPFSVAVLCMCLGGVLPAQAPPAKPAPVDAEEKSTTNETVFPAALAGRWRSSAFELSLTSDLDRSVYGPRARSIRVVEMTIQPSGEGVLTITNSVRNAAVRVVAGTRQIDEARFTIGDVERPSGMPPRYLTRVVHAERRYPDDAKSPPFELNGAKVFLYLPDGKSGSIEVRFEPPEGTGSFWETVRKVAGARAARS